MAEILLRRKNSKKTRINAKSIETPWKRIDCIARTLYAAAAAAQNIICTTKLERKLSYICDAKMKIEIENYFHHVMPCYVWLERGILLGRAAWMRCKLSNGYVMNKVRV